MYIVFEFASCYCLCRYMCYVGFGDSGGDVGFGDSGVDVGFGDSGKRGGDFSNSAAGDDNSCEVWLQRRGKE